MYRKVKSVNLGFCTEIVFLYINIYRNQVSVQKCRNLNCIDMYRKKQGKLRKNAL
jgi:hypothetical protein